jgi:homoserine acetyltransferase
MENKIQSKRVGNTEYTIERNFSKDIDGGIEVRFKLTKTLQKTLKKFCVNMDNPDELVNFNVFLGYDSSNNRVTDILKRYRVRREIFGGFLNEGKDLLFTKDLIDNGELTLKFQTAGSVDQVMSNFKDNCRRFYQMVYENDNVTQKVVFEFNQTQ